MAIDEAGRETPEDGGRRRGSAQVYEELREDILWLRLKPGAPLDEMALARRFGISRTPIREALLMLAGEDLVQLLPKRTSIVAPHSLDNLGEHLDVQLMLSRAVARTAAVRRTESDVARMRNGAAELRRLAGGGPSERAIRADHAVRRRISKSARNSFLYKFYGLILDYGTRAKMLHLVANATDEEASDAAEMVSALVETVAARDPEGSDRIMTDILFQEKSIICRCMEPAFGAAFRVPAPEVEMQAAEG